MPTRRAAVAFLIVAVMILSIVAVGDAAIVSGPDTYLCYKASLAKGQPKLAKDLTTSLDDRFAAAQTFDVKRVIGVCSPANRDGTGITNPAVHLESFAIKAEKGAPKLVKTDVVAQDPFDLRTLTVTGRVALLDVTPLALGASPPSPFASDPTSDPNVNRFTCYKAKLAKGSAKFAPPLPPTVSDDVLGGSRDLVVKKVTKLCVPVDEDGATPGAESRSSALVCYAVKLAKGSPKFVKTTVATNTTEFVAHVLVASAVSELCVPAVQPTPTPTASPTATLTASPTFTPSPTPTFTASPTPTTTPSPGPAKRVFLTSTTTNGAFGGTTGADAICANLAANAGLSGTYKAWVSVTGDGVSTRFTHSSTAYRLVDGTLVANDWTDLSDGTLAHAINRDESGNAVTSDVWTATNTTGAPLANDCSDFTSSSSGVMGTCGNASQSNSLWTNSSAPPCSFALRLYCFEQ